jgi:exopolyphosphatase / guanosine-5'-triphosphate,3'-diphosphate pyrophosphatase
VIALGGDIRFAAGNLGPGLSDFGAQVLASARTLGEKYGYDADHAQNVAQLATRLFDQLTDEHALAARERLLLEVAALLHDIGLFVGLRAHHKHTQYLLESAEIFGLSRDDMRLIANVARYHRRAVPRRTHLSYMMFSRKNRVCINKLAAILRLANALDAEHLQKIRDVRVSIDDGARVLLLEGTGDLTMERLAATARADLLNDVLGRRVILRFAQSAS